jgi:hypothetical protein
MKRINIFALVVLCLLLAFLVGCEKLEVPTLDEEKEEDKTELPENKPSEGEGSDVGEGNDEVNDEDAGNDTGTDDGGDSGSEGGEENVGDDSDDKYQGYGSLEEQINYGGTFEHPFRAWDLSRGELGKWILANGVKLTDCWVEGYIVGYVDGNSIKSARLFETSSKKTNILIADDTLNVAVTDCVPVQLSTGSSYIDVRNALNLADNPDKLRCRVKILGAVTKYMGVAGLKNAREHEFVDD